MKRTYWQAGFVPTARVLQSILLLMINHFLIILLLPPFLAQLLQRTQSPRANPRQRPLPNLHPHPLPPIPIRHPRTLPHHPLPPLGTPTPPAIASQNHHPRPPIQPGRSHQSGIAHVGILGGEFASDGVSLSDIGAGFESVGGVDDGVGVSFAAGAVSVWVALYEVVGEDGGYESIVFTGVGHVESR